MLAFASEHLAEVPLGKPVPLEGDGDAIESVVGDGRLRDESDESQPAAE